MNNPFGNQAPAAAPATAPAPAAAAPAALGFGQPAAAPATAPAPGGVVSRYAGIAAAGERTPQPHPGRYVLRILKIDEGVSPRTRLEWFRADFEIVSAVEGSGSNVGEHVAFLQMMTVVGPGRVKQFLIAATGLDEDALNAYLSANGDAAVFAGIVGRHVDAQVSRGQDVEGKPGEFYRDWLFQAVPAE